MVKKNIEQKPIEHIALNLDLLSFVSHELKTPLSTLRLSVDLLKKSIPRKEKKLVKMIDEEINWMIQFISNILDLKNSGNKAMINPKLHQWNQWIQIVQSDMMKKTQLFKRTLKVIPSPQSVEVCIDPIYVRQALLNLIMNAIEHSPKNSSIEMSWQKTKLGKLSVHIRDKGPGINLQDANKIFEPFYKGAEKTYCVIKRSGLGLSIAKAIAQAHGGGLSVKNHHEKGAIFTFSLPLAGK